MKLSIASIALTMFAASCGYNHSSKLADESTTSTPVTILQDVQIKHLNGGFNPDAFAVEISGRVELGSNACVAGDATAELKQRTNGNAIEVYAEITSSNTGNQICTADYNPVFAEVDLVVRAFYSEISFVTVKNAEAFGNDRIAVKGQLLSTLPGQFKLYSQPGAQPNPSCDVFTSLVLNTEKATLEERLGGFCEIYIAPNTRSFNIAVEDAGCGSRVYKGEREGLERIRLTPTSPISVEIIDHRGRVCRDLQPAKVIVKETLVNGDVVTRYSTGR